jgi:hypothetical protein
VKPIGVAVFAAGYILGAKAGRERYSQIVAVAERASQRLDDFSSRNPPGGRGRERSERAHPRS